MCGELLPTCNPAGSVRIDRELPLVARRTGRVLDLSALLPGDLLLFRSVSEPLDYVSSHIVSAQLQGGLAQEHAKWTHAAVYLGDDEHICEANFGIAGYPNGIIMRSAHTYCDGQHAIRARRPKSLDDKQRLRVALGALSNLNKGYSFSQIWDFYRAARSGRSFWLTTPRGPRIATRALVCSTLYQDALNFAYQGATVRLGNLCTPAHLSASSDFESNDPTLAWLEIQ